MGYDKEAYMIARFHKGGLSLTLNHGLTLERGHVV